jgi:PHP family Zn ribbon phosphoesterase
VTIITSINNTTRIRADLHIHTVLSPCAEDEMTPHNIIRTALLCGLDAIAITDHNSTGNLRSFVEAARGTDLKVIPGVEIQTQEEVHVLGLFKNVEDAEGFGSKLYMYLPDMMNKRDYFGPQFFVDAEDNIIGEEERMLLNSTSLRVEDAFALITEYGGLGICAHVDRPSFSIIGQLGFIPVNLPVAAVEVSWRISQDDAAREYAFLSHYPVISSSDAHRLNEIGKGCTVLYPGHRFWNAFESLWKGI